jgi:hypothetical protein
VFGRLVVSPSFSSFIFNPIKHQTSHNNQIKQNIAIMGQPKVLVVLTSASEMGPGGKPTGWYLVSQLPIMAPSTRMR